MKRITVLAIIVLLAIQAGLFVLLRAGVLGDYDSSALSLVVYFLAGTWFFAIGAALLLGWSVFRWFVNRPNDGL